MRAHIVPIGNSKGIRIPSSLLKLCHIQSEVDLTMRGSDIVISPLRKKPRSGWENAFQAMNQNKEDRLIISDRLDLDLKNWKW